MPWLVIGLSLGSALGSAISTTLKWATASRAPSARGGGAQGLAQFTAATATSPLWLVALLADTAGVSLQVLALHYGALALVQPLLVSGLVFALLLRHVGRWRLTLPEALWAVVLAGSLVAFLLLSGAASAAQPAHADHSDAIISAIAVGVSVLILLVIAHRNVPPAGRAALLGVAVGAIYATSAALIKAATTIIADHGPLALLGSWQLYTALTVAASGLVLAQITFQAGPLNTSLPAIATVDPLLSVLIGLAVYNEHLNDGPGDGSILFALLAVLLIAIIGLARVERPNAEARVGTALRSPDEGHQSLEPPTQ